MLVPAILYSDNIYTEFLKKSYSEDMLNYMGCLETGMPEIQGRNDGGLYQYAILDNDKLIGYFTYQIDWYSSTAHYFGLIAFEKNNKIIGLDVHRELKKLINDYKIRRLEWRMVGGNPVERHYDKFCQRYHGRKLLLHEAIKDRQGQYHDDVIYEIVFKSDLDDKT